MREMCAVEILQKIKRPCNSRKKCTKLRFTIEVNYCGIFFDLNEKNNSFA